MILVAIDRTTIRKNPNAGSRTDNVLVGVHVTFETDCPELGSEVSKLLRIPFPDDNSVYHGILHNPDLLPNLEEKAKEVAEKGYKFIITHHRQWQQIYSLEAESKWLYEYLDPNITCSHCKAVIKVSEMDIEEPYNRTFVDKCPKCLQIGTFEEVQFEDINDVVKEMGLV